MPHVRPEFYCKWKITVPSTLAGKLEAVLFDGFRNGPIYGARSRLIEALLERWLAEQRGDHLDALPPVPSLEELRKRS